MAEKILIVAQSRNRVIGKDNQMPWHLPADFRHFKETTMGHPVILGRKTYDSLGKALPGRPHHVISRDPALSLPDAQVHHSPEAAFDTCASAEKVFLIGGASLYQSWIDRMDRLIVTWVDAEIEGDAFFPAIDPARWQEVASRLLNKDEKNAYDMRIVEYLKRH